MGTPPFSATVLEALADAHEVVGVYTRPDAVRGRGRTRVPSAVKEAALKRGLPVFEPVTLRDEGAAAALSALRPDVVCVAAYGAILPPAVLAVPPLGCVNVHASLLPRWRGAAPVERAVLAGDAETGVCIMRMEAGLDTGAYCARRVVPVEDKSADALTEELARAGAEALLDALDDIACGQARWVEQDEEQATYADKIGKGELDLSLQDGALTACRKVRASSDAHPAHAVVASRRVTVVAAAPVAGDPAREALAAGMRPGDVRFAGKRLLLGAADGAFELVEVKPEGKRAMPGAAFAAGLQGVKQGGTTWEGTRG